MHNCHDVVPALGQESRYTVPEVRDVCPPVVPDELPGQRPDLHSAFNDGADQLYPEVEDITDPLPETGKEVLYTIPGIGPSLNDAIPAVRSGLGQIVPGLNAEITDALPGGIDEIPEVFVVVVETDKSST